MLERFAEDVWIEQRPLRFFGVETGTRMTVVRLADGGLFVHSPVALDGPTRDAVDALGPVRAIVAPSLFHHLYVGEWTRAYPKARCFGTRGLDEKRKDIAWTGMLGDAPADEWKGSLEQVHLAARSMENEVVFFHRASRTIVSSDFMFNLASHPSGLTRLVARLLGQREPGATLLERVMMRKHRESGRAQIDRILAWDADRLVLAHGEPLGSNATEAIRRAYAWL